MAKGADTVWNGERNRQLDVYRPCPCGVCSKNQIGVGYLSSSDAKGRGFTIWIVNEEVFRRLRRALRRFRENRPGKRPRHVALQNTRGHT